MVIKLSGGAYIVVTDDARLANDIARQLSSKGFGTSTEAHEHFGDYVLARKGNCQILAGNAHPIGHSQSRILKNAKDIGPTTFQYGSRSSPEFPRFWPVLGGYFQRYLYRLGIEVAIDPILAVSISPQCSAEDQSILGPHKLWATAKVQLEK